MSNFNSNTLYTIGYSTHRIEYFIKLLKKYEIQAIADVRSYPHSTHNPDFSIDMIKYHLKLNDISYVFLGKELGARRSETECYKDNKVDYKLVKKSNLYIRGIRRIINGVSKMRVALMCAEQDPISCHRAILIARTLVNKVDDIRHILPSGGMQSQKELDERLLDYYANLKNNKDFFIEEHHLIDRAYELRGKEIAYECKNSELDT